MFYKIGHRGAAGYAPENTLKSFKKALTLNIDMIELDVHICKTGEIMVNHDNHTKKNNNKKELLKNKTYSELRKLKIPRLESVLSLIDRRVMVNIELKGKNTALPVAEIVKKHINQKKWKINDFLISSFDKKELRQISIQLPKVRKAFLVSPLRPYSFWIKRFPFIFKKHLKFAKEINSFSINLHRKLISKKIIEMAHKENLKVFAYTANNQKEIAQLKENGVDGIFSDFPDRL